MVVCVVELWVVFVEYLYVFIIEDDYFLMFLQCFYELFIGLEYCCFVFVCLVLKFFGLDMCFVIVVMDVEIVDCFGMCLSFGIIWVSYLLQCLVFIQLIDVFVMVEVVDVVVYYVERNIVFVELLCDNGIVVIVLDGFSLWVEFLLLVCVIVECLMWCGWFVRMGDDFVFDECVEFFYYLCFIVYDLFDDDVVILVVDFVVVV